MALAPIGALSRVLMFLVASLCIIPLARVLGVWLGVSLELGRFTGIPWHEMLWKTAAILVIYAHAVAALVWMYRARRHAMHRRPGGQWGPAGAVVAWLIPYGFLVLGYVVMREIWRGTTGEDAPRWILAGWLAWALPQAAMSLLAWRNGVGHVLWAGQPLAVPVGPVSAATVLLGWGVFQIVAAVFFVRFVGDIASWHDAPLQGGARPAGAAGSLP